mmetsp:Transcript_991/g.1636  ORF Transcript_991/g.1636 Transcript_991/m.1636 type:complete len:200 (+) Transcript_991:110-709(+)
MNPHIVGHFCRLKCRSRGVAGLSRLHLFSWRIPSNTLILQKHHRDTTLLDVEMLRSHKTWTRQDNLLSSLHRGGCHPATALLLLFHPYRCRCRCRRTYPVSNHLHIYPPTTIRHVCGGTASLCHAMHLRTNCHRTTHYLLRHIMYQNLVSCHFCILPCTLCRRDSLLHLPHHVNRLRIRQYKHFWLQTLLKFHCRETIH